MDFKLRRPPYKDPHRGTTSQLVGERALGATDPFSQENLGMGIQRPVLLGMWLVLGFFTLIGTLTATTTLSTATITEGRVSSSSVHRPLFAAVEGQISWILPEAERHVQAHQPLIQMASSDQEAQVHEAFRQWLELVAQHRRWQAVLAEHASMGPIPDVFRGMEDIWLHQEAMLHVDTALWAAASERLDQAIKTRILAHQIFLWTADVLEAQKTRNAWLVTQQDQAIVEERQLDLLLPLAYAAYMQAQKTLNQLTVNSPIDGHVELKPVTLAQRVSRGELLGEVSSDQQFLVQGVLSARDTIDMRIGMPGDVVFTQTQTHIALRLHGRVVDLSPLPLDGGRGEDRVYQVKIDVSLAAHRLPAVQELQTGQEGQIIIQTQSGTVLWYLLRPLLRRIEHTPKG